MNDTRTDLLGNPLSTDEAELLDLHRRIKALARRDDLPPVVTANCKQAMVYLWNACNDLVLFAEPRGGD